MTGLSGCAVLCGGRRWMLALLVCGGFTRLAAAAPLADAKQRPAVPAEVQQSLDGLAAAQRSLADSVAGLRAQLAGAQQTLDGLQADLHQVRDEARAAFEHDKQMREEVRGLYVEASSLKGDIGDASAKADAADDNLSGFRMSAGIVAAVVILLQVVLLGLLFRGRA